MRDFAVAAFIVATLATVYVVGLTARPRPEVTRARRRRAGLERAVIHAWRARQRRIGGPAGLRTPQR